MQDTSSSSMLLALIEARADTSRGYYAQKFCTVRSGSSNRTLTVQEDITQGHTVYTMSSDV
jgi:hypothetical protein